MTRTRRLVLALVLDLVLVAGEAVGGVFAHSTGLLRHRRPRSGGRRRASVSRSWPRGSPSGRPPPRKSFG